MTDKYYYMLVSKLSDKALDVASANTDPGSRVCIWSKNSNANQQWYDDVTTGTIRTKLNDYCLELDGDNNLVINPYQKGSAGQQWVRTKDGYVRNSVSEKVLEIIDSSLNDGAPMQVAAATDGLNQQWIADWAGPQPPDVSPDVPPDVPAADETDSTGKNTDTNTNTNTSTPGKKAMRVVSAKDGKVLDVGTAAVGARIALSDKDSTNPKSQQWYADENGFLRSMVNDVAIDAAPNTLGSIQLFNGEPNQQWKFEIMIKNQSTGEYLDLYTDSTHGGSEAGSYRFNDGAINQKWSFEYI